MSSLLRLPPLAAVVRCCLAFNAFAAPIGTDVMSIGKTTALETFRGFDPGRSPWRRLSPSRYRALPEGSETPRTVWQHAFNMAMLPLDFQPAASRAHIGNRLDGRDSHAGKIERARDEIFTAITLGMKRCHSNVSAAFMQAIDAAQGLRERCGIPSLSQSEMVT